VNLCCCQLESALHQALAEMDRCCKKSNTKIIFLKKCLLDVCESNKKSSIRTERINHK
jgi:hypothetical protein